VQHLAGTNLFYAMQEKRQQIRDCFDRLFPSLCHSHPAVFPPALFTWYCRHHHQMYWHQGERTGAAIADCVRVRCRDNFLWAYTACSSRSFPQTLVQQAASSATPADPYDLLEVPLPSRVLGQHVAASSNVIAAC
jgi:hypothetical protein